MPLCGFSFLPFFIILLSVDTFIIHFRLLLMLPYSSFRLIVSQNLVENHKTVLVWYRQLRVIKKVFQKKRVIKNQYLFALWYIVLFTIFYRLDLSMREYIERYESGYNDCIKDIDRKIMNGAVFNHITYSDYQQSKEKKETIFSSLKGRLFLYKASIYIFVTNRRKYIAFNTFF